MTRVSLQFDARQHQTLTPRLQYAVRLLQLSSLDYEQELHEVMGRNPFLETDDAASHRAALTDAAAWSAPVDGEGPALEAPSAAADFEPPSGLDGTGHEAADRHEMGDGRDDRDDVLQSATSPRAGNGASTVTALDLMVADVGLRGHLHSQAGTMPLSARDRALVAAIVESLDDDGYLRTGLDEIGALAGVAPAADASELSTALKLVQSLDPPGVGARGLAECLTLQLDAVAAPLRPLAECILAQHIDKLGQRDVPGLCRLLGAPAEAIDAACAAIRRLDPRPGWRFGRPDVQFVTPDVIVRKSRGQWQCQLNGAVVPRVKVNQTYAELFQRHREARHAEMASHLQEARWAVKNVEQRFSTILSVAQSIVRRQALFFEHGAFAMKPLGLREVADEVGLHESTVCRVTNNKYMATPAGVFELKHFFSRAMPMASGGACSATAIRGVIKEMIEAEDPIQPLSDVELATRLSRQGLTVARRTITKYRQMMKFPPVETRRRIGAAGAAGF